MRHGAGRGARPRGPTAPPLPSVSPRGIRPRTVGLRMEERRLLLAVALSLLVLTAYSMLFPPAAGRGRSAGAPAPAASPAPAPPPAAVAGARPRRPRRRAAPPAPRSPTRRSGGSRWSRRRAPIAFTNRGARLLSWQLARFKDQRGHPEEMVQAVAGGPRPLDLETGRPGARRAAQGSALPGLGGDRSGAGARARRSCASSSPTARSRPRRASPSRRGKPLVEVSARVSRQGPGPAPQDPLGPRDRQSHRRPRRRSRATSRPRAWPSSASGVERPPTAKLTEAKTLGRGAVGGRREPLLRRALRAARGPGGAEVRPVALAAARGRKAAARRRRGHRSRARRWARRSSTWGPRTTRSSAGRPRPGAGGPRAWGTGSGPRSWCP